MLATGSVEPPAAVMDPERPGPWMVPIMVAAVLLPTWEVAMAAWWLAKHQSDVWEPVGSTNLATVAVTVMAGSEGRVNPSTPIMIPEEGLCLEG